MSRTLLLGGGLGLLSVLMIYVSFAPVSEAPEVAIKASKQPVAPVASDPRELMRLESRLERLAQDQTALSDDLESLYQSLDEQQLPVDAPDRAEVLARAQGHQHRLERRLLSSTPDPQAEQDLREHVTLSAGGADRPELLSVQCSAELCRVDVAISEPDPLGLLMSCPVLGGELMSAPNQQDSSIMTFFVARRGPLPG